MIQDAPIPIVERHVPPESGFTIRLERADGGAYVMTDPRIATLRDFLPRGVAWLKDLGLDVDPRSIVLPE